MTDYELDQVIQRILIDAQKADEEQAAGEDILFNPSVQYQHNMRAMCKNPNKWQRNRDRPVWKNMLRRVAMVLLAVSIGFGGLMVCVPSVRAAVIQWAMEWYETHIVYRYSGDDVSSKSDEYDITALPSGFSEVERTDLSNIVWINYADDEGNVISFDYCYIHQGGGVVVNTEDASASATEITVNGMTGHFFEAESADKFNTITWIDEHNSIQFTISGLFDKDTLLYMAMSVSQELHKAGSS
jgi:hypothetical protein